MTAPQFDCPRRGDQTIGFRALTGQDTNLMWADYIEIALDPVGHPVYDDDGKEIPPKDYWSMGRDGFLSCSYCGSMRPEDVFAAIDAGTVELGPTDKSYKVYVHLPDPRAGEQRIVSAITFQPGPEEMDRWVKAEGREHIEALKRDGWINGDDPDDKYTYLQYTTRDQLQLKCYMHHFNRADASRLRDYINSDQAKIGYPGRFYNGLWLARPVKGDEA